MQTHTPKTQGMGLISWTVQYQDRLLLVAGIVQKVFSEKGVGNNKNAPEMRHTCVKNPSKMRQNGSCFSGKRGTFQMCQKCTEHLLGRTPFGRYRLLQVSQLVISSCRLAGIRHVE